jgi:hypothetical protein
MAGAVRGARAPRVCKLPRTMSASVLSEILIGAGRAAHGRRPPPRIDA